MVFGSERTELKHPESTNPVSVADIIRNEMDQLISFLCVERKQINTDWNVREAVKVSDGCR